MRTSPLVICEILGVLGNTLTANHMYSRNRWKKFRQYVETLVSQKRKTFSKNVIAFLQSRQNSGHFGKKDLIQSLNILEFNDPKKCSYFNARKLLVLNTLPESTCSGVPNTAESYTAALLSQLSINLIEIDLEKNSLSRIENLRIVW